MTNIFDDVDARLDNDWVVKEFFNSMYSQDRFVKCLAQISERIGYVVNCDAIIFPNFEYGEPEYHFEGVKVSVGDEEQHLTDENFEKLLNNACEKFLQLQPSESGVVNLYLEKWRSHSAH